MTEYSDSREMYEDSAQKSESGDTPSLEGKGTAGKQLLIIIQLVVCGIAILFMLIMKLIGGDFCGEIINLYKESYNASIIVSGGGNDISIFSAEESSSESSEADK